MWITEDGGSVARDESQCKRSVGSCDWARASTARASQLRFARGWDTRNLELSVEGETTVVGKLKIKDSSRELRQWGRRLEGR